MARRDKVRCGTLIVLDWIAKGRSPIYEERRKFLEGLIPLERVSLGEEPTIAGNSLPLTRSIADADGAGPRSASTSRCGQSTAPPGPTCSSAW